MYKKFMKRILECVLTLVAFIVLLPFMVVVSALLFIANGGSPFFTQVRVGYSGRLFNVIKFKTMNDRRDSFGCLLPDSERLTPVGKFLRSTSLDELPQLINVLKGDMSLVGPRPLLEKYLPLYNQRQRRRHEVRPGITGWAQINGRNAISWHERFELDIYYVDNIGFWLDIKIMLITLKKVFKREGITQRNVATMEPFRGNN